MIQTEIFYKDGVALVRTWSDLGMYIHGGYPEADYEESIDPVSMRRVFTETDRPIEDWEEPETMISSANIANSQYFSIREHLFLSTKSIAVGDDIVPGKNCAELNITDVLNEIADVLNEIKEE